MLSNDRIEMFYLRIDSTFDLVRGLFRAMSVIKRWKPDVAHTHLVHAGLIGRIAARLMRVPAVMSTQHNAFHPKENTFLYILERKTWFLADCMIGISAATCDYLRSKGYKGEIACIRTGVNIEDLRERSNATPTDVEKPYILSVGHLRDQHKGHDILISAFATLLQKPKTLGLVIVGDGDEEKSLKTLAQDLGVEKAVRFLGPRNDVPSLIRCCEVFVLASRWEGLGLAALEAMALGKPVIVSAVEGLSEIVLHNESGVLTPPENPRSLSAALDRVIADPRIRHRLGQRARVTIEQQWNSESMAREVAALYGLRSHKVGERQG